MEISPECLDLMYNKKYDTFNKLLDRVNEIVDESVLTSDMVTQDFVDSNYFDELKSLADRPEIDLKIGKSLRELQITIKDDHNREHSFFLSYKDKTKLKISNTTLPHDACEDQEYPNVEDSITAYRDYVDSLCNYLMELERVDRFCTVIEPKNPTFKDDYRKIQLEGKLWLHVDVMKDGTATNIHLVGDPGPHKEKLQAGLAAWDHDKDIVDNVMDIFDLMHFTDAQRDTLIKPSRKTLLKILPEPIAITCGICLSSELETTKMMPQPLCSNLQCGVYFHVICLYEWLIASSGGRVPALGIATGVCPSCFNQITVIKS